MPLMTHLPCAASCAATSLVHCVHFLRACLASKDVHYPTWLWHVLNSGVTLRRQSKPSNTHEPTQRAIKQTVEAQYNCKKQCRANDTK